MKVKKEIILLIARYIIKIAGEIFFPGPEKRERDFTDRPFSNGQKDKDNWGGR